MRLRFRIKRSGVIGERGTSFFGTHRRNSTEHGTGAVFNDYNCRISSIDFHKTSTYMVTASDDDSIRLYDVASATQLTAKKYGVDLVCFTSQPTAVIYSSRNGWDNSLRLLSLHDNKYLRYFKGHHDNLCSGGECFISGSLDRTVLLWDQIMEKCQVSYESKEGLLQHTMIKG